MKKILLTILLAICICDGYAQNTQGSYTLRVNDEIVKQLVSNVPGTEDAEEDAEVAVWDLREMIVQDEEQRVCYDDVVNRDELVCATENSTRYYYEPRQDSLLLWGYENRLTKVSYDRPLRAKW